MQETAHFAGRRMVTPCWLADLFQFPKMDAGGFFEVVAGVEDFGAVPEGDVAGDFAVADGVEEEESAFAGDVGLLCDEFGFAPALGDDFGEAGGAGGEFAIDADGFPSVAGREGGVVEEGFVGLVQGGGEADGAGVGVRIVVGGAEFDEAFGGFEAVVLGEVGIARGGGERDAWKEEREESAGNESTYAQVHGEG